MTDDETPPPPDPPQSAEAVWEQLYTSAGQRWSGRPNVRLVELVANLAPGTAVDLGCGEGGDAVWLATRGWQVTAVDVSPTALARARRAVTAAGVAERVTFECHDLTASFPAGRFDLVSALFLHNRQRWDRPALLRRAAAAVAAGGTLLVVDHGCMPPWSTHHDSPFATAEEVLAGMELDPTAWSPVRVGAAERDAAGPDGRRATLLDSIVMVRRTRL